MALVYCQYWFKWVTHSSTGQLFVPIWPAEDAFGIFLNCLGLKLLAWKKCRVFLSNATVLLLLLFRSYISRLCAGRSDWQWAGGSGGCSSVPEAVGLGRLGPREGEKKSQIGALAWLPCCPPFLRWCCYVNCLRVRRSGIWQTPNGKVLSTSRYGGTAGSHHNGFVCVMGTKCIWSQEWHHMLYLWPPQQFFIALRLVACAQNGLEVALKSLNVAVPPPKFVSPLSTSSGSVYVLNAVANKVLVSCYASII